MVYKLEIYLKHSRKPILTGQLGLVSFSIQNGPKWSKIMVKIPKSHYFQYMRQQEPCNLELMFFKLEIYLKQSRKPILTGQLRFRGSFRVQNEAKFGSTSQNCTFILKIVRFRDFDFNYASFWNHFWPQMRPKPQLASNIDFLDYLM